jgi:preprotein translocase subunit SecF
MISLQKTAYIFSISLLILVLLASCSKRSQCPAYMEFQGGTISVQDKGAQSPDDVRKQSQKLLDSQDSYIMVKRDKRTGLVKSKKRVKKGKNNTNKHKGFEVDPRTMKGVK